jgi:hypothetical protein
MGQCSRAVSTVAPWMCNFKVPKGKRSDGKVKRALPPKTTPSGCDSSLESKHNSSGRLDRVGNRVGVQLSDPEVGCSVDQAAILRPQRDVIEDWKVGSSSVGKHADGLLLCSCNRTESVACRIEHQHSALREDVGMDPESCRSWEAKDETSGGLMNVSLDPGRSGGRKELLGIATVSVNAFAGEPAVEMIAIANQKSTCIGGMLRRTLASGVLCKQAGSLQTHLRTRFLSHRSRAK